MKRSRNILALLVLVISLAACDTLGEQPGQAEGTPAALTEAPAGATPAPGETAPVPTGKPPQTNAALIQPPERRDELTRLSDLFDYQVTGLNGAVFGQVTDYVINTCETYIIYFMVTPAADLEVPQGSQLVIPFEAVTINSGILKADEKAIALYLAPEHLSPAPAFEAPLALLPYTEWEPAVRDYWSEIVRIGVLHSECKAGGSSSENAVHKIAYASELLGAELKDFNQNPLGTVKEAILEPESGKLGFYVVDLVDGQGLVMVPLGKTNIPEAALEPGQTIELVLLAENAQLFGAPRVTSTVAASDMQKQAEARQYWGQ